MAKSLHVTHAVVMHQVGNDDTGGPGHPCKAVHKHHSPTLYCLVYERTRVLEVHTQASTWFVHYFNDLVGELLRKLGRDAVADSEDMRDFPRGEGCIGIGSAYGAKEESFDDLDFYRTHTLAGRESLRRY